MTTPAPDRRDQTMTPEKPTKSVGWLNSVGPLPTSPGTDNWFTRQAVRTAEDIKTLPDWLRTKEATPMTDPTLLALLEEAKAQLYAGQLRGYEEHVWMALCQRLYAALITSTEALQTAEQERDDRDAFEEGRQEELDALRKLLAEQTRDIRDDGFVGISHHLHAKVVDYHYERWAEATAALDALRQERDRVERDIAESERLLNTAWNDLAALQQRLTLSEEEQATIARALFAQYEDRSWGLVEIIKRLVGTAATGSPEPSA